MTDDALPNWVLWGLLFAFAGFSVWLLVLDVRRKARWQRVLGVRMQQEAVNDDWE